MGQQLNKFSMPNGFRGKSALYVQLWWLVQATLFAWSPQFCYKWRRLILRAFGAQIGKGVLIRPSVKITYPWKVSIGDYSWIGDDVVIYSLGHIKIGKNTVVSQKSYLCAGSHDYLSNRFDIFSKDIIIGNGCWLATDVFVSPGVSIEDDCLVGARCSVFNDLDKNYVYVGNPAKKIKARF